MIAFLEFFERHFAIATEKDNVLTTAFLLLLFAAFLFTAALVVDVAAIAVILAIPVFVVKQLYNKIKKFF